MIFVIVVGNSQKPTWLRHNGRKDPRKQTETNEKQSNNDAKQQNNYTEEKPWELRKLSNVLQWHKNDPQTHNKEEVLPEACKFRKINDEIWLASIQQLKARQVTLSTEE